MGEGNVRWQTDAGIGLVLVAATLLAYWPVSRFDFVNMDDPKYVSENAAVAGGLSPLSVAYAWTTFDLGNWIPLTWLSYELDASLFGVRAPAFHAVNLAWHALNVLLLYAALRRMTSAVGRSAAVALLFSLHPLHVESVAWISERKDVLSTAFLLLTLLAYEWYARRPAGGRLAVVSLTMAMGLLAKPMLVTLPVLLLLVDLWPLRRVAAVPAQSDTSGIYPSRTWPQLLVEKVPLFALSLADGFVTILAQRSAGAMRGTEWLPLSYRESNAIAGYGWYLWKTVWPSRLCAFYPLSSAGISSIALGLSAAAVVGISACVFVRRRRAHLVFGWLWFVMALLPVSGLVQAGGQAHADRYAYVPHIGLFTLIVWGCWSWLEQRRFGNWLGLAGTAAAAISLALLSRQQVATWRNSETLWAHVLKIEPDNYGAHAGLGMVRMEQRDWEAAERHFRRALLERPAYGVVLVELARLRCEQGEWEQAAEYYAWALRVNPRDSAAADGLAELRRNGRLSVARKAEQHPPAAEAVERNRRGLASARQGKMEGALAHFQEALALEPEYAEAHNNAGLALKELGRLDEAERHLREAVSKAPDNADFHVNLATVLLSREAWEEAREQYAAALRLKPHDVEARFRLEQLRKRSGAP